MDRHNYVLKNIQINFERQAKIDLKVKETNDLIFKSKFFCVFKQKLGIEIKRNKYMEDLAKNKEKEENEKKKVVEEKKKKQVEQELAKIKEKYEKVSIFL